MKSREEYQASIFAKRDALLKKRKRNAAVAASALFIAVGISSAAVFAPQYPREQKTEAPDKVATVQSGDTANNLRGYEEELSEPEYDCLTEATEGKTAKSEATHSTELYSNSKNNTITNNAPAAAKPEIGKNEIQSVYDGTADPVNAEETSENYSSEEISAVAFGFLTDEQKKEVLDPKSEIVTASSSESGESYYEVFFKTENGGYKVKLSANTLDFIETKAVSSTSANISPPYIPKEN
ncbi:MAG: hypothetical protein ACI4I3_09735 [Acutalibacteraceae bacterium]